MHTSETRSGGKRGWRERQRKTWLYLAGKTGRFYNWTGERAHIRYRPSDPETRHKHSSDAPRHTQSVCAHTHTTGPLPGADAKSLPGAPSPPRPKQSRTDGNTAARPAHLLAGAVCMALSSADFRMPEGEMTHVGRQWRGESMNQQRWGM